MMTTSEGEEGAEVQRNRRVEELQKRCEDGSSTPLVRIVAVGQALGVLTVGWVWGKDGGWG